ncbi:hypothetical protein COF68_16760 [Bacillus toyonensis]|uniref:ATP-binding protein n=1 Tax=Bacillus toyonensis TaxID=155322 RepID=UPI000BFE3975|nr:ATP-binding protein [Bacillus toyonensis]PHA80995.1 hypothetical protein COE77_29130 [Bacillus toyonensis]PHE61377.1 hypothetical protein COF68_16760 [Bacillus toyonensis]PHF22201.1 hypothetical protein COF79_24640 [Bacillus toyonensis]
MPATKKGTQLILRVIMSSYESRVFLITTKSGVVFADDQMAAAMIDQLAHHGHLLVFAGEGYRTKHALMKER